MPTRAHPQVETLEPRQLLSAGDIDTTFGRRGSVLVPGLASLTDLAVQSSGKILILGADGKPEFPSSQYHLVRLNIDGSVDAAFDAQIAPFIAQRMFLESDGKILVLGVDIPDAGGPFVELIRYNADGSVDTTFHGGVPTKAILPNYGSTVARQSDGKIVIAYLTPVATPTQGDAFNYAATRLNADGTLDRTFGTNGEAAAAGSVGKPGASGPDDVLIDKDGNIAVIGFTSDNGLDSPYYMAFGPDGNATRNGGIALPFLSESRQGGSSYYNRGVVRPDDTPVVTLAANDFPTPAYVAVGNHFVMLDPDPLVTGDVRSGNVINAGNNTVVIGGIEGREIGVTRLAADGNPDPAYGFAGASTPLRIAPRGGSISSALVAQATGGAYVAAGTLYPGNTTDNGQVYVARFAGGAPAATATARGPAAVLDPIPDETLTLTGVRRLSFDVKYTGIGGIDPRTLDNLDLRVVGDNGFSRLAEFVGLDNFPGSNGQYAIYSIRGPGGHWNTSDAGEYHVILRSRQVRDAAGRPAPATEVGAFTYRGAATTTPAAITRAIAASNPFATKRHRDPNDLLA
ncbi:MAG: hypothetical protein JWN40_4962 [Phycisphaerales bacterium]|nr:hypothetical protein [Phycisphaerales bacterium]